MSALNMAIFSSCLDVDLWNFNKYEGRLTPDLTEYVRPLCPATLILGRYQLTRIEIQIMLHVINQM